MLALDHAGKHLAGTPSEVRLFAPLLEYNAIRLATVLLLDIFEPFWYVEHDALNRIRFSPSLLHLWEVIFVVLPPFVPRLDHLERLRD